jgi:hypothetical protein
LIQGINKRIIQCGGNFLEIKGFDGTFSKTLATTIWLILSAGNDSRVRKVGALRCQVEDISKAVRRRR